MLVNFVVVLSVIGLVHCASRQLKTNYYSEPEVNKNRVLDDDVEDLEELAGSDDVGEMMRMLREMKEEMQALRVQMAGVKVQGQLMYRGLKRMQGRCAGRRQNATPRGDDLPLTNDVTAPRSPCRAPFIYAPELNTCLRLGTDRVTWRMARERCLAQGADLVTISSEHESRFINQQALKSPETRHCDFWIGLTDDNKENEWRWVANDNAVAYSNWNYNEPNNGSGNEHCVHTMWVFNWRWNDARCNHDNACYVCQKRPRN